jgi:hypothetical protein
VVISKIIQYACPTCKHLNTPKGKALTLALTCEKCNLYFCTQSNIHDKFKDSYTPIFAVGSVGLIEGVQYRVMGFAVKRERKYRYIWHEYFLFNPNVGIAFLTQYDGNWNFLKPYSKHPWSYSSAIEPEIEEGKFKLYAKYRAEVLFASGEFFTDIIDATETSTHYEHIAPPYILNFEDNHHHLSAYLGEYISPAAVAKAFNLPIGKLPSKKGMGYTEPLLLAFEESTLLRITGITLVLAVLAQFILSSNSLDEKVIESHFSEANLNGQKMFTTQSFELKGGTKNVEFKIYAPISNDWFFAEYSLINEQTSDEYVFTNEIEYYYGYEGGESWREGSTQGDAFLSSIPEGKYHINIFPEFSTSNHEFTIWVYRDVPFHSNLFVFLFLLLLFPIGFYIYKHRKERKRWEESDFSPYTYDE